MTMMAIAIAATAVKAVSTISAGVSQAQSLRLQAKQAELQGRQNALNYNRQAVQVFERQQRLNATVRARAAAAGIDPLTGSPLTVQQYNEMAAGREAQIAQENAQMAIYGSLGQSQSLQSAASSTMRQAFFSAVSDAATSAYKIGTTATPGQLAPVETRVPEPVGAVSYPVR